MANAPVATPVCPYCLNDKLKLHSTGKPNPDGRRFNCTICNIVTQCILDNVSSTYIYPTEKRDKDFDGRARIYLPIDKWSEWAESYYTRKGLKEKSTDSNYLKICKVWLKLKKQKRTEKKTDK